MKVRFSAEAKADLAQIAGYIGADDPERAISFIDQLEATCLSLADFPGRFPLLDRYEKSGVRQLVHGNYLIFYRVEDGGVMVLRVLHGARDYMALLFPDAGEGG